MSVESIPCKLCGRVPTRRLPIRRHVGLVVLQKFIKVNQPLCRTHGAQLTKSFIGKTLMQGWWGLISFFVNWFVLLRNLIVLAQYRSLPEPTAAGVNPPVAFRTASIASPGATVAAAAGASGRTTRAAGKWDRDPYLRNELRWFDGIVWTNQVGNGGIVTTDEPGWR